MSEWPNERAWKVRVLAMVPWVRIPPSPQDKCCSTSGGAAFFIWRASSSLEWSENKNADKRSGSNWLEGTP